MKNRFVSIEEDNSDEDIFGRMWNECKFCDEKEEYCKCIKKKSVDKYKLLNEFLNKKEKQNERNN